AQRDQALDYAPKILRLRQSRADLLMLDQGRGHVGEHRLAMAAGAVQFAAAQAVTHGAFLLVLLASRTRPIAGPAAAALLGRARRGRAGPARWLSVQVDGQYGSSRRLARS